MKYNDISRLKGDRFLFEDRACVMEGILGYSGSSGNGGEGDIYNVQVSVRFDDGTSDYAYFELLKKVTDSRVRVGDLVDVRLADERTIRGSVTVIDRLAERPYCVKGPDGGTAWFAAWEFDRFLRADSVERAVVSLAAVRERIAVLEKELVALRLSEEILEGVYL